ncbi:aspartate 1-decarboxylase [Variovorax sp. YR216]|nr:aspartate 1-decarboxylase [Variovorax sp. YR216]
MFRILLKSKIHRATVTDCGLVVDLLTTGQSPADNGYAKDNPWDI